METALQVAYMAILKAVFEIHYLTIEALDAWTPSDITVKLLNEYAKRYTDGTNGYFATAQQRGVVVQVVNYEAFEDVKVARHFVFVVFKAGSQVPQCDWSQRSRFYQLKRLVHRYWATDHHRLSSEVLKQQAVAGSAPQYYLSSRPRPCWTRWVRRQTAHCVRRPSRVSARPRGGEFPRVPRGQGEG